MHVSSDTKSARVDRIVLHIGTEKTGTSTIQHFLSKNRDAFAAEGVVYPRFTGANGGSQWGFVAAVQKRPWKSEIGARLNIRDEDSADAYRQRLLSSVDEELLACPGCHTLILSSEHFHSRLRTPEILRELKSLLGRWSDNVQVMVYFRRQDRVAVSHYSTKLKSGQPEPDIFPNIKDGLLPYYYDYERIYANWSRVFGKNAVQVGVFAPQRLTAGDLLTDFCRKVELSVDGKFRPAKINESLSEAGVQLLLELNRQWPKKQGSGINPSRELLVACIARENVGRCSPATRNQAKAFYAQFEAGNARLSKAAFPSSGEGLFDVDFGDYPENLPSQGEDRTREVRKRIRAWRAASVAEQAVGVARRLFWVGHYLGRMRAILKSITGLIRSHCFQASRRKSADLPPVILHMGLPKTATTTLRNTLYSQHPGICYLLDKQSGQAAEKSCASKEIYLALKPILWRRQEYTNRDWVRSVLQNYSKTKGKGKPLLGAWETLLNRPPRAFQAMLREMQDVVGDLRVIVTLRNPLKRLPSAYLHALSVCAQKGCHHSIPNNRFFVTFDEWLAGSKRGREGHDYRFDFDQNVRFATEFLGRDKVGVFLMEDFVEDRDSFFSSVERFIGVESVSVDLIADKHLNKALTVAEFEYLKFIDSSQEMRQHWIEFSGEERRLRLKEIKSNGDGARCRIVLTDDQRELIDGRSREFNRWLVDTFDLDLTHHKYPL